MDARRAKPQRVQLRRSKGWRMPAGAVKVDRTTRFGNPFSIREHGHDRAVELHRAWLTGSLAGQGIPAGRLEKLMTQREKVLAALPALRGKTLACWCPLPKPGERDNCHAALLLELANVGARDPCEAKAPGAARPRPPRSRG
jgi:uncharacterized protein DUF4326